MMKKFYALLIAAAMMISVTACGSKTPAKEVQSDLEQMEAEVEAVVEEAKEVSEELQELEEGLDATGEGGLAALEEKVLKDVEGTISALTEEYDSLVTEVDSYEKYLDNVETVEGFYAKILSETQSLCIRMREYSVEYANTILASDKENDEKYSDLEELYDCVYDEAGEEIYDEIYDGILDDVYDDFYNGILDDAYEDAEYSEWSDARSNEYEWWSDARSDVYDEWSDFRSEVYDFWSDLRGEMWDDDMEKAMEIVEDFKEGIEKRKGDIAEDSGDGVDGDVEEQAGADEAAKEESKADEQADLDENSDADLVDGMRPEFKEAMDSYEEFYEEYCEVLKQYMEDPTDVTVLTQYSDLMQQSIEMAEKFEEWDNGELNTEELKYYVEVNGRVTQMLVEASGQ